MAGEIHFWIVYISWLYYEGSYEWVEHKLCALQNKVSLKKLISKSRAYILSYITQIIIYIKKQFNLNISEFHVQSKNK